MCSTENCSQIGIQDGGWSSGDQAELLSTAVSATATDMAEKHPDNERRRQMREAWRIKKQSPTAASATAARTNIAAAAKAAGTTH
jgi:hypothetical protein